MHTFKNAVSWFEIPVLDIHRAKTFYEGIFDVTMQEMVVGTTLKMALFPTEEGSIGGALCEHHEFYHPGSQGPLVYLNANPDLQTVLSRAEKLGAKVLVPKTQISPEYGHMAVFEDSEGNRIALHSRT